MNHGSGTLQFVVPSPSLAAAPRSEQRVSTAYGMSALLEIWLRITGGPEPLGPGVSLHAALALPALEARVIFRSGPPGSHSPSQEIVRQLLVVRSGERIVRPWRPVRGIPRGSDLVLKVLTRDATLLAEEPLGECRDGFRDVHVPLSVDVNAVAWVMARDWSSAGAPRLRVRGELVFTRGVMLRLGMRGTGERREGIGDLDLARPGAALFSTEKICDAGVQDNRWVSVVFVDENGNEIGDEQLIGRCVRA